MTSQKEKRRYIVHAFYASTTLRGGKIHLSGGTTSNKTNGVEVVDELLPLFNVEFSLRLPAKPKKLTLEPEGVELPFTFKNGVASFKLDSLVCHQLIVAQV